LVSIVVVAGEMVRVPFDGLELGPPPQPAMTSTSGAAQAKSERKKGRVIVTTIQVCCQLYVPGVSVRSREAPRGVSQKSYGRERRTGAKHQIDEEVARLAAADL
jgi:hypothetical protein